MSLTSGMEKMDISYTTYNLYDVKARGPCPRTTGPGVASRDLEAGDADLAAIRDTPWLDNA
jgi:hypothetical protein